MTVAVYPHRPRVAVPCRCIVGEGPVWDGRTGTLLWVDIVGQTLWSWRPDGGREAEMRPFGEPVSFVHLTPDPDLVVVGLKSGVAAFRLGSGSWVHLVKPEPDRPGNRLNDAGVGPDGALYFGSMDDAESEESGRFYRWTADGLDAFGGVAVVTNGPAIDAGRGILYASNTSAGRIYRHALRPGSPPGPAEPFVTFRPGDGHPDGMTIDEEGHLWVCHFGAGRVTRFTPEGAPVLIVPMPTGQPTKPVFGGPDLATLYVTTAARNLDPETDPHAGNVLCLEPGVRGLPTDLVRVDRAA